MIPQKQWKFIVECTIGEMIDNGDPLVEGWEPAGFEMHDWQPDPKIMRETIIVRCFKCIMPQPVLFPETDKVIIQLRPWCYYSGHADLWATEREKPPHDVFFIRWIREPYGFLFGICPVCNTVPFIFFPSGQATFFYMTQIGRESCIQA